MIAVMTSALLRPCWLAFVLLGCSSASPDPAAMAAAPQEPAVAPERRQQAEPLAAAALELLGQHRTAAAEAQADDALALDPGNARARAVLGLCLLQRARASSPPDLYLENTGDGETLRAVRSAPHDPIVVRLRGEFLATVGHLSAAAATAEELLGSGSSTDAATIALLAAAAEWRYELGEERAALVHLRPLVVHRHDDAQAHFRLGSCLLRTAATADDAVAAARAFARSAELLPGDRDTQEAVGRALVRAAELAAKDRTGHAELLTEALASFTAVAARFGSDAEPEFLCGVVLEAQADSVAAAAAYDRALQRDGRHLGALLNLAGIKARRSATEPQLRAEAEALFRRALEVDATAAPGTGLGRDERARIAAWLEPQGPVKRP